MGRNLLFRTFSASRWWKNEKQQRNLTLFHLQHMEEEKNPSVKVLSNTSNPPNQAKL